jgi:hypothetical protein
MKKEKGKERKTAKGGRILGRKEERTERTKERRKEARKEGRKEEWPKRLSGDELTTSD